MLKNCSLASVYSCHTHTRTGWVILMWWDGPTWWRAREAMQEQMGRERRGTGNEGAKRRKVGRAHWQFGTTITAPHTRLHLPLLARHHPIPPNPFAAHWCCNESVICTHMYGADMVLLWDLFKSWWKHLQASGQNGPSICTLTSYLPLGTVLFFIIGFREDERNWNKEEMEIAPFHADYRGHYSSRNKRKQWSRHSCLFFALGLENAWWKCPKSFDNPLWFPDFESKVFLCPKIWKGI